ncbi:hypothetical protein [Ascidiimonas sp. W6]|uniref:hypothetical protein n=1 Tax=Ascidiimonas meishanensis TaxID=3128903 RepID=UPI0030EEE189
MYFKRLLLLISIIGLIIAGFVSYNIHNIIFSPNTNFNQSHVMVRIHSDTSLEEIYLSISPFLKDVNSFKTMAQKRALGKYVKSGVFKIKKGMSNNDIIDVLTDIRSSKEQK